MRELLKRCAAYIVQQNDESEECKNLMEAIKDTLYERFPICVLSRSDFEEEGYSAEDVSEEDLEKIIGELSEYYIDYDLFWAGVRWAARELGFCTNEEEEEV